MNATNINNALSGQPRLCKNMLSMQNKTHLLTVSFSVHLLAVPALMRPPDGRCVVQVNLHMAQTNMLAEVVNHMYGTGRQKLSIICMGQRGGMGRTSSEEVL